MVQQKKKINRRTGAGYILGVVVMHVCKTKTEKKKVTREQNKQTPPLDCKEVWKCILVEE